MVSLLLAGSLVTEGMIDHRRPFWDRIANRAFKKLEERPDEKEVHQIAPVQEQTPLLQNRLDESLDYYIGMFFVLVPIQPTPFIKEDKGLIDPPAALTPITPQNEALIKHGERWDEDAIVLPNQSFFKKIAYFKYFKWKRSLIVLYDASGWAYHSIEAPTCVPGDSYYKTLISYYNEWVLKSRHKPEISYFKQLNGIVIKFTACGDIVDMMSGYENRDIPAVTDQEFDRFKREIFYVSYCSAYSAETVSMLQDMRNQPLEESDTDSDWGFLPTDISFD